MIIKTIKRRIDFIFILFLLLSLLLLSLRIPETNAASQMQFNDIAFIIQLIKTQYIEQVDDITLLNGAIEGMKKFLEKKKLSSIDLSFKPIFQHNSLDNYFNILKEKYENILQKYKGDIEETELLYSAVEGMLASLNDPYTVFLDPKEYKLLMEHMSGGNFGGVGIYIALDKDDNNKLMIVEPIEDTPAYQAGLKSGDHIIKINGKTTDDITLDTAQRLIRGPIGSTVILTIERKNEPIKDYVIVRNMIHVKSISSKMLKEKIGYIKLRLFGEHTEKELSEALWKLKNQGVKSLIVDLRNNGGGYITAAIDVCNKFLPPHTLVVSVMDRYGHRQSYYTDSGSFLLYDKLPLVILVNKFSASAAEITAGALKEYGVAVLIGNKTYGKGTVQNIQPLRNGSAVKYTVAKYYTPKGRDIDKKGIEPDIKVDMEPEKVGGNEDIQLDEAIKYLKATRSSI